LPSRIGIDLDNTILRYDEVFYSLAQAELWIDRNCLCDKDAIKKGLTKNAESAEKSEKRWQQLQAWAYGKDISKALVYDGLFNFTKQARLRGDELFIVSHKTEFSNFDPSINLRRSALDTLGQRGFFKSIIQGGLGFSLQDIFFASSLDEKVKTIRELKLTHFIDDLSKVICHPDFPQDTIGILFEPGIEKGSEEKRIFRAWDDAEEFFSLSSWFKAELASSLDFLCPFPSSGNNRVCKIRMENGEKYVVKKYLQLSKDSRPRLQAEFGHLSALWQLGYRNIPKPILREESRAVYSLIKGVPVKSIGDAEIKQVLIFLTSLSDNSIKLRTFSILPGSDFRACLRDYIDQIEKRYNRITQGAKNSKWEKEVNTFMKQYFLSTKEFIFNKFYDSIEPLGWDVHRPFEETERMFCPSDFGFHNILADTHNQEELFFLDFEYSGWDDPAKLLADFFHHVGQDVSWEHKWFLLEQFAAHRKQDPNFLRRWETVIDLIGLEWVLIVLNVIDPNEMERKRFANPALDPAELVKIRLAKAGQMINEMAERMRQGEDRISIPPRKQMVSP